MDDNKLHFISRFGSKNIGDFWSSPYHYFDFNNVPKEKHSTKGIEVPASGANIIVGGGMFPHWRIDRLVLNPKYKNNNFVFWGVGSPFLLTRKRDWTPPEEVNSLFGFRDYGTSFHYAPCASCMLPQLDKKYSIKRKIGVYCNKGYTDEPWYNKDTDIENLPHEKLHNQSEKGIDYVIKFLGESETIITSSYHGAYWSLLLGRKVTIGDPLLSNPNGKYKTLKLDLNLEEARNVNKNFYDKVMNFFEI
jgi:hypothetical protein